MNIQVLTLLREKSFSQLLLKLHTVPITVTLLSGEEIQSLPYMMCRNQSVR